MGREERMEKENKFEQAYRQAGSAKLKASHLRLDDCMLDSVAVPNGQNGLQARHVDVVIIRDVESRKGWQRLVEEKISQVKHVDGWTSDIVVEIARIRKGVQREPWWNNLKWVMTSHVSHPFAELDESGMPTKVWAHYLFTLKGYADMIVTALKEEKFERRRVDHGPESATMLMYIPREYARKWALA
jgi:hypothetical protein